MHTTMQLERGKLRDARLSDAEAIAAIYEPIVRDTVISFESVPPTPAEMAERVSATLERFPWIVCEDAGVVLGYANAGPHRQRHAYRWAVETSIYIAAEARGRGVGKRLLGALLALLRMQGYVRAYAGITLPNSASVALHERAGFRPVGVYRGVGYKAGAWRDVGWWELTLGEPAGAPPEPIDAPRLIATPPWREVLRG